MTYVLNIAIISLPFFVAILYPAVGALAGMLGSISGFLIIYLIPTLTYLKSKHTEILHPMLAKALMNNDFSFSDQNSFHSAYIRIGTLD